MSIFECFDAAYGSGLYESIPDGAGGMNILHDGLVVDHMGTDSVLASQGRGLAVQNFVGGTDVIIDGKVVSHAQANVFGGMDTYEGTELVSSTVPNAMGGVDIYSDDMSFEGSTVPNVFGGEDFVAVDNTEQMMKLDDPLAHASDFRLGRLRL